MSTGNSSRSRTPGALAPLLRITAFTAPGQAVVVRLDGEAAPDRRRRLDAALSRMVALRPARLVVDLAGLAYCDTTSLDALLGARAAAQAADVELLLASPTAQARRLLESTGPEELFTIRDSVLAALGDTPAGTG
ncbi:STAS domain-containing protein [Kitasatospora sp. NPDC127111]|uniref:STAS domain-containing protein n=1 Tax=Kitasatospora sp. NPDC127111 TaxID=3345363 RepID=UPI003630518B